MPCVSGISRRLHHSLKLLVIRLKLKSPAEAGPFIVSTPVELQWHLHHVDHLLQGLILQTGKINA